MKNIVMYRLVFDNKEELAILGLAVIGAGTILKLAAVGIYKANEKLVDVIFNKCEEHVKNKKAKS